MGSGQNGGKSQSFPVSEKEHAHIFPGAGQTRMALGHLQCAREGKSSQKVVSRGRSTEGGWKENRSGGRRINPRPSGLLPFVLMSTVIHIPPARSCRGPGSPCVPAVVVIQTVSPPASPLLALRFSNVLLQPCINTAPPVPQAQVLVNEWGRGLWTGWALWISEEKLIEMGVW